MRYVTHAMATRNSELLKSFVEYCDEHPNERFWQALRNWCGYPFVGVSMDMERYFDTFYFDDGESKIR